jgi:hypothetical protein
MLKAADDGSLLKFLETGASSSSHGSDQDERNDYIDDAAQLPDTQTVQAVGSPPSRREYSAFGTVKLTDGHVGVAGSLEMPTVLEFEGHDERLFVWRYRRAWCVKPGKPRQPADAATAPPLLGGAKKPPAVPKPEEFKPPVLQEWRSVATLHANACLKSLAPRLRSNCPASGKPFKPDFIEKTVELGRTMEEPKSGWKPAGIAGLGETGPAWGSWAPPWGQQPAQQPARSQSLPALRKGGAGVVSRRQTKVTTKELGFNNDQSEKPETEFRFVARAMAQSTARPKEPVSLESAMKERRRLEEWRPPEDRKPVLPSAIGDLIGYGDVLFEPPSDEATSSAQVSTMTGGMDSRSGLHDSSVETFATVYLPELPKAKAVKSISQASTPPLRNISRMAAEKEAARSIARSATRLQHVISPVKASIEHMLL